MRIKDTLLIAVLFFSFSVLSFAQSELVIELTTDNYPDETSWTLYDVNQNVIGESGVLEKETTHRDTFSLDDAKCYYWTLYDAKDGIGSGANPGDYNIYFNGTLVAGCDDPSFVDSVSAYNLGLACSPNDVGVLNIQMLYYLSKDKEDIKANIVNMGVEPISSLELFYKVDDFTSSTVEISNLSIEVGEVYEVVYPIPHDFTTAGNYTVELTITKVNGEVDNTVNNSASLDIEVLDGFVQYNVIEDFMSYECGPCYDAAVMLDGTLEHYEGTQSLIKYMMWDFADTKYFLELEDIGDYYNVGGVPHIRLNGEKIDYRFFTPTFYLDYIALTTPVKLTVTSEMVGDSLITNIKMFSDANLDGDFVIRALSMEKTAYDVAVRYDNNDPYHNVVYDIINGIDGIPVESVKAGVELEFSVSNSIIDYPFEEGSFEDMSILIYLQEEVSFKIYQSKQMDVSFNKVEPELVYNIENEAIEVDTAGLEISIYSNRYLFSDTGKEIGNINEYFKLKKDSETGVSVPFVATINVNSDSITVKPIYGWETGVTYLLQVDAFSTIDEIIIPENTLTFSTKEFVGIDDILSEYVNVYPNPAKDNLTINSTEDCQIKIISTTGQVVSVFDAYIGQNTVNISNFKDGIYFIKVQTSVGIQMVKFIKQ